MNDTFFWPPMALVLVALIVIGVVVIVGRLDRLIDTIAAKEKK